MRWNLITLASLHISVSERVLAANARPFIAYWPFPREQSARRPAPREAFDDACTFVTRCGKRLGIEAADVVQVNVTERLGGSNPRLAQARDSATVRFGAPEIAPGTRDTLASGPPHEWIWTAPSSRIAVVLQWLEEFADCAVGGSEGWDDAICASCGCAFWPRDLNSGRLLPGQHRDRIAPVFWSSGLTARLQTASVMALSLFLPFDEPNDEARQYLLELRTHLPVVLDADHLYHFVPRPDLTKYDRHRLGVRWLDG